MKIPQEFFVTTINEMPDKNFGIGGKTIDKVKAEYIQTHSNHMQAISSTDGEKKWKMF